MSWTRMNPEEPKLAFVSKGIEAPQIADDLKIVVDKMIENRQRDNATKAKELMFFTSAANGYINIAWCDFANDKYAGDWSYWLELKDFWKLAGESESVDFDDTCRLAIYFFAGDHLIDEKDEYIYESYIRTILGEVEKVHI